MATPFNMATSSKTIYFACHMFKNVRFKTLPVHRFLGISAELQFARFTRCPRFSGISPCINSKFVTDYAYIPVCHFSSSPPTPEPSEWAIVRVAHWFGGLTEKILYKISPKLHVLYRQFIDGGKDFIGDVKFVYRLRGRMRKDNIQLHDLPWKDIYTKDKVTRDMGKVIPTMIVTWLPMAFYVMLPLIFTFPRQFLSDHFLNRDQLLEFQRKSLEKKYEQEKKIWQFLKKETADLGVPARSVQGMGSIEHSVHLDVDKVLKYRAIFGDQLRLENLPRNHLVALCKLHSLLTLMLPSFLLRRRLEGKHSVLLAIDSALRRDGIEKLEEQDLRKLCYQRVFPTYQVPSLTMQSCLYAWLQTTAALEDSEKTLYLHLPLFKKKTTTAG